MTSMIAMVPRLMLNMGANEWLGERRREEERVSCMAMVAQALPRRGTGWR
jgi:hypothetical protein